jgi:D-tyrosyl-tRNA(Tyr) deacylase
MRAVIQRVRNARLQIGHKEKCSIGQGMLVLLGIEEKDELKDVSWLSAKIIKMRIFNDAAGLMNLSVQDIAGSILLVSQFTLYADVRKGNRPSFIKAARPEKAIPLYESMIEQLQAGSGLTVKTGIFGADMQIELLNDGPVTIILDSKSTGG